MRADLIQADAGIHHPEPVRLAGGALKVALAHPFEKGHLLPFNACLLYTSDAADDLTRVDLGGRRIIKKKKKK